MIIGLCIFIGLIFVFIIYRLMQIRLGMYFNIFIPKIPYIDNDFINFKFLDIISDFMIKNNFSLITKTKLDIDEINPCHLEHYVNSNKEILFIVLQNLSPDKKHDNFCLQFETYFDDGTHLITSSKREPEVFIYSKKHKYYSFPYLSPEQLLNKHKDLIKNKFATLEINTNILNTSLYEMNKNESKELLDFFKGS